MGIRKVRDAHVPVLQTPWNIQRVWIHIRTYVEGNVNVGNIQS